MPVTIDAGDLIAGLAFLLSGYATWQTVSFNKKQKSLVESQEKLNNRLLEKENEDALKEKRADLGASFIKLGSRKYRLKIWNKGAATAKNVRIEFPEGNDVVIDSEVTNKFPLERLERHQSVELIAAVHMQTKRNENMLCGLFGKMMHNLSMKNCHIPHYKHVTRRSSRSLRSLGQAKARPLA